MKVWKIIEGIFALIGIFITGCIGLSALIAENPREFFKASFDFGRNWPNKK